MCSSDLTETAVVTGKPVELGGSRGRSDATGRGCMIMCEEAIKRLRISRDRARVIVQGFGNVGSFSARHLYQEEYPVIGIVERDMGLHNPGGIDVVALMDWKKEHGTLRGFPGAEELPPAELMERECEILLPAATENQITTDNAPRLKCKIIVEGANGPTTSEADEILDQRGIFVVPDILANAGGVTVSYFEWVQDRQGYFWSLQEVRQRLDQVMRFGFADVMKMAEREKVRPRMAAYMLAIEQIGRAHV